MGPAPRITQVVIQQGNHSCGTLFFALPEIPVSHVDVAAPPTGVPPAPLLVVVVAPPPLVRPPLLVVSPPDQHNSKCGFVQVACCLVEALRLFKWNQSSSPNFVVCRPWARTSCRHRGAGVRPRGAVRDAAGRPDRSAAGRRPRAAESPSAAAFPSRT